MLTLIEALNYRCLRYVRQPLSGFHVLVGPNGGGKSTFLDVPAFLGDLVAEGLDVAVKRRGGGIHDLLWARSGASMELAIETAIPETLRALFEVDDYDTVRYEVAVGIDDRTDELSILAERVVLKKDVPEQPILRSAFPSTPLAPETIIAPKGTRGVRTVVHKVAGGNDNFYSEMSPESGKGWIAFKLGARRSALGNLPADESKFPVATWLKEYLSEGVRRVNPASELLRRASPPGLGRGFLADGSNLPWVVDHLRKTAPERFAEWMALLNRTLPELAGIKVVDRPEDLHRYIVLSYTSGIEIPSWMASEGTLRLLALTLPAFLPGFSGVYLIEEPENSLHPGAIEIVSHALASVQNAQILMATHSPVILALAGAGKVLCFGKTAEGATDIIPGSEHPPLLEWRTMTDPETLFAGGVLG